MRKIIKTKVFAVILALSMITAFTGCSSSSRAKDSANKYIQAINSGDYETAFSYTALQQYEFITPQCFAQAYQDCVAVYYNSNVKKVEEFEGYQILHYDDGSTETIDIINSGMGFYRDVPYSYTNNCEICVLKGSTLSINDKPVNEIYKTYSDELYDYYNINALANCDNKITTNNMFGESTVTYNPTIDTFSEPSLSEDKLKEVLDNFGSNLNKFYKLSVEQNYGEDMKNFFPPEYHTIDEWRLIESEIKTNRKIGEKYTQYTNIKCTLEPQPDCVATIISPTMITIPVIARVSWLIGEDYEYERKHLLDLTVEKLETGEWRLGALTSDVRKITTLLSIE